VVLSAPDQGVKGPRLTAGHLLLATSPDHVAAVFLGASLFYRTNNRSHGSGSPGLPHICVLNALFEWMQRTQPTDWLPVTNRTLPDHDSFRDLKVESTDALIQLLAIEAAHILHRYVPVVVAFVGPEESVTDDLGFDAIPELEGAWRSSPSSLAQAVREQLTSSEEEA
jgi:hypothetical protein